MNLDSLICLCLWAYIVFAACAIFIKRLSRKRRARGKAPLRGSYLSTSSIGNALHQLQTITQPHVKYALAETLDEEAAEEDSGDPDHEADPKIHLLRQAAKIRRGEKIDQITALLTKHKEPS